jgi:6-phosphogluconolactonase (cycloisomerase 2 family)
MRIRMIHAIKAMLKPSHLSVVALLCFISGSTVARAQVTCVYVNDNLPAANSVEGYKIGATSATHVGPAGTGGSGSATNDPTFFGTPLIVIAPGTTHLYASDTGTNDIALFNIDSSSCKLTFVAKYPAQGSSLFGLGITISPDGRFLYATNSDRQSTLAVLPINSDGSLGTAVQTVDLPANLSSLAIAPNGKVLIVTQPSATNQVQSYIIDPASGKVTFASEVTTVAAADGIAIDLHSKFVYVGNGGEGGSSAVQVIQIGQGGSLTYVANIVFNGIDNPAGIPGSSNCLLFSPNGKLLLFTNQRFATVVSLSVNSQTGGLTFIDLVNGGEGFVDEPSQMAASASRGLVFTGDFSTGGTPTMGVLRVTTNGTLKLLGNLALTSKAAATSIAAFTR